MSLTFHGFFQEMDLIMTSNAAKQKMNPRIAPPTITPYIAAKYFTSSQLAIDDMLMNSGNIQEYDFINITGEPN